jgi:hypothetical protein
MFLFRHCCFLIAGLLATGCKPSQSVDLVSAAPAASRNKSENPPATPYDEPLLVEQVLNGNRIDPFANPEFKAVVLVFVSTECPIANRYASELTRLYEAYQTRGVSFWLVYADAEETVEKIRKHVTEYHHQIPALRDADHQLVKLCEARRTPEAVVFAPGRDRKYRGRIDDRFQDYGKSRKSATQHDLQDAIEAVLAGKPVPAPETPAIGCYIPGIDE